ASGPETNYLRSLLETTRQRLKRTATNGAVFKFEEVPCDDPHAALDKDDIQLLLEASAVTHDSEGARTSGAGPSPSGDRRSNAKRSREKDDDDSEPQIAGAPRVRIIFRGDHDLSARASARMSEALRQTRREQRAELLSQHGIGFADKFITVTER